MAATPSRTAIARLIRTAAATVRTLESMAVHESHYRELRDALRAVKAPQRKGVQITERVNGKRVRCYHDPKAADRYTVVYLDVLERVTPDGKLYGARAMDDRPFHPQGIGLYVSAMVGKHLGRRICFADLPADCRRLVKQDTAE